MTDAAHPTSEPTTDELQSLCEQGSVALQQTKYIEAERAFERAESIALAAKDFDTLSRLYFPLQEARRQKRQRCGEGVVRLDLLATSPAAEPSMSPRALADRYPQGQLLLAGWRSVAPAAELRRLYRERGAYAEVFLAAVIPVFGGGHVLAVVPREADLSRLPESPVLDLLPRLLPPHTLLLAPSELPSGEHRGGPRTFAHTMMLWERLHLPYLALADTMPPSEAKLNAYHGVTEIDYACELAHQRASFTARELARLHAGGSGPGLARV